MLYREIQTKLLQEPVLAHCGGGVTYSKTFFFVFFAGFPLIFEMRLQIHRNILSFNETIDLTLYTITSLSLDYKDENRNEEEIWMKLDNREALKKWYFFNFSKKGGGG